MDKPVDKRKRTRKRRPTVVSRHGRYRFQTGMVTASLLERGLPMDAAFEASRLLRDKVAGMRDISTAELEVELDAVLVQMGLPPLAQVAPAAQAERVPLVRSATGLRPFDRGLLVRDLFSAGVPVEAATELVGDLLRRLCARPDREIGDGALEEEAVAMVEARYDLNHARRYRLTRWLRRSDRPVVILLGGATGTGKSTLAMELAFRLGIRMAISTDMIRETMRTVLSPEVVPGLHDHSFRGIVQVGQVLSDPRERVLAGFRQQASQVAVGIRAVVRRALRENTHLIIEGTHLLPPFEQYLPYDGQAHVAGMVLGVPSERRHLERFPERAGRAPHRDAATYLDSFQAVRWIHDDLLQSAEDHEALVLTGEDTGSTATLAVEYLSQVLPVGGGQARAPEAALHGIDDSAPRTLFIVLDGLSDEPNPALGGRTPLAAAGKPWLDMLAGCGGQGQVATAARPGVAPGTDEGLRALLGWPAMPDAGRGLYEALGQGIAVPAGAVVFRGNLATVAPDGSLIDRRAGRIRAGTADLLAGLRNLTLKNGLRASAFPGHEHRLVVMLQGEGLSAAVGDSDPGGAAPIQRPLDPRATDDTPEAARTAEALREFLDHAAEVLSAHPLNQARIDEGLPAANCIITRGAAQVEGPTRPSVRTRGAMVSACPTALGVARAAGVQGTRGPTMTGNLDTDIEGKLTVAATLLQTQPFVVVHLKGTDIAAHDRRPAAKRDFIARFDRALGHFLSRDEARGLRIVVSADHGTSSVSGNHLADPVPLLLATWDGPCDPGAFDEESAARGALGLLDSAELSQLLWAE
jgi:2,3-bisphosphoglycerate-independent phosphoglycerate mutase